jgi:hypothetical protein
VQLALGDIRNAALASRALAAGETPACDDRTQDVARRMTFGALFSFIKAFRAAIASGSAIAAPATRITTNITTPAANTAPAARFIDMISRPSG